MNANFIIFLFIFSLNRVCSTVDNDNKRENSTKHDPNKEMISLFIDVVGIAMLLLPVLTNEFLLSRINLINCTIVLFHCLSNKFRTDHGKIL